MAKEIPEASDGSTGIPVEDSLSKQQQLKLMHYRLMAVYEYAIETVCRSGPLPKGTEGSSPEQQSSPDSRRARVARRLTARRSRTTTPKQHGGSQQKTRQLYKHRPITRALVEVHIRAKLDELRTAYAQIEQSIPDTDSACSFREWLRDTQDSLARFSATLTVFTFVRRILTGLWPLVIALATIGAVWHGIRLYGKEVLQPGLANSVTVQAVIATLYILSGLGFAAYRKRAFFLASISISSTWANMRSDSPARDVVANNIYEAEDELFSCINKPKRPEYPVDSYLLAAAIFGTAMAALFHTFSDRSSGGRLLLGSGIVFVFLATFSLIYLGYTREPR